VVEPVRTLPRALDVALAAAGLLVLAPIMAAIALAIAFAGDGPILYSQVRLGRRCAPFRMHKFRTLTVGSDEDSAIAPEGDPRATRVGRWLRHSRLDELPQLYDVLRGSMALVGPRPETPANLAEIDREQLEHWLSVLPGLTGPTQLAFIAEDELLADAASPTALYRNVLVPAKARHGIAWLERRSVAGDLAVLLRTPLVLASRRARQRSRRHVEALLRGDRKHD
jgi:lipopolysaccharide/colanic/teichoic acid biosynthesis glycosyltransferase